MSSDTRRYWVIVGLVGVVALVFVLAAWKALTPGGVFNQYRWDFAVCIFGMAVGASEMVGRYRDAPFQTLSTTAAVFYVAINAVAAFVAYLLIRRFNVTFQMDATDPNLELVRALVAGFGSMAFFRSSLFNIKVGDTDVPVGPGIFFQVLLFATDRACDRERARKRTALVSEIMNGVSFSAARDALPNLCFDLMQNLPASEALRVRQGIESLASAQNMRDADKVLSLGLMLMNVVGSDVLESAVETLGPRLQEPAKIELDVFTKLQDVDFERAFPILVKVCFVMSRRGLREDRVGARNEVIAEIEPLTEDAAVDNDTKVLMLALALQQRFGDGVLEAALTQLGSSIRLPEADVVAPDAGPDAGGADAQGAADANPEAPPENGG